MAFFEYDENDAQGDFKPIPAGEYELICSKATSKTANSGNQMISMELTVRDDIDQEGTGRKIFNNLVFTEKTKGIVAGALKAFGAEQGQTFESPEEMAQFFAFKPVRANISIENSEQYGDQNRVKFFKPAEAGGVTTPDDPFNGDTADVSNSDLPF